MFESKSVAVVGGGPAGLMAAEVLIQDGLRVALFDAMPSVGRKFLMAGKGGLNLTHSEPIESFLSRYDRKEIVPFIREFGPEELRGWAKDLGIETFAGTSGRVFPLEKKAAPLLRAWLHRLRQSGVKFHMKCKWSGFDGNGSLRFETPEGPKSIQCDAAVLALGGGSWARLGSDGAWMPFLSEKSVRISPLKPANCGFDIGWSEYFRSKYAGCALKSVALNCGNVRRLGELMMTSTGLEGGLIYAFSALLRDAIEKDGYVIIHLDLAPGRDVQRLMAVLSQPRGSRSMSNHLRLKAGIEGVKTGLLREILSAEDFSDPATLALSIKSLPLRLTKPRPLDEAISTAGGISFSELDSRLMLRKIPGIFCAGEMLDWEAPTGGYLLTACFATGRAAGLGASQWLRNRK